MSNRSLATAKKSTVPVARPVGGQVLQRQGIIKEDYRDAFEDLKDAQSQDTAIHEKRSAVTFPPPLPPDGPGKKGQRTPRSGDFASLRSRQVTKTIHDDDIGRALLTEWLIQELAPLLGLDPNKIEVRVNADAESRLNSRGASGLMESGTIYLHPNRYQPQRSDGRYLLAHEAAHVAQRLLNGPEDEPAAEAEAAELGRDFATGRLPRRPRFALVGGRAAADVGAKESAPPAIDTDVIKISRARELAVIRDALGGLWVSDGDVFDVLRILDGVPYPIVKPLLMALDEKERFWLADNINPPHVYQHRRSVLACYYDTLSPKRLQDAMDLKVLRAMPWRGMSSEEIVAGKWVLQNLSQSQRDELLASSNRLAIKCLIMAPMPSAQEMQRIKDEREKAFASEFELRKQRQAIADARDDADTKSLFAQVRDLLSPPASDHPDPRPTGAQALAALDLLARANDNEPQMLAVAEKMEEAGLIDHLLELLPAHSFFDTPPHSATLLKLVNSRLPFKNEKLIEDLLSYGLFDWAIRDYEALFAYRLIRMLPISDQYKFRLRDGGKWYLRLLDNLPDDPDTKRAYRGIEIRKAESRDEIARLRQLGATEVDEEKLLYNASELYEKKRKEAGTEAAIKDLVAAFENADKDDFENEETLKDLFRRLRALGGPTLDKGREKPADALLRDTVVHELDRMGLIERLFKGLPDKFLFAEENRVDTVRLMLARDPARVTAMARRLVSYHLTDWMVNDGEAYLAYQCIKALPEDERRQFIADEPDLWARVTGEMSESQRQSRDLNAYIGDRAGTDRGSVLGRLAEAAIWTDENAAVLGDLVRMAIAMTEHKFAFERSREFKAIESKTLAPLVEKYRLWDPKRRPVYTPDILQGTHWYEEGVFASLKSLWGGIVTLATADFLLVDRKVGIRLDLGHAQDFLGGDLMGAKVDESDRDKHPDRNKVTLLVSTDGQSVELILPELVLESANVQLGGATLQSGRVTLEGLHVEAAYQSESLLQPARAQAKFEKLVAEGLLLAKTSSMVTATRLTVNALRLAAGTIDTVAPGVRRGGETAIPVPLLVVPMLPLLLLLGLPAYLIYRLVSFAKSLPDQGLQDPGQHLAEDIISNTKAISFTLGSLDVDSLTTSGGQHVGKVSVRDFSVRAGMNKATRLRAEARSLSQRIGALPKTPAAAPALEALEKRRAEVDAELKSVDADETEYLQIMREIRAGKATPERQKEMQRRLDALKFDEKAGAFIDIGAVEVSGLSGTVTSKEPIRVANVHGEGGGSALAQFIAMPTATDAELSRRSAAGERPANPLDAGQDGHFVLDLGDIKTGELQIGGGLRTLADIEREIVELEPKKSVSQFTPLYESLLLLREKARRYEIMLQHGVSRLDDAQLAEFRQLRSDLTAQADLVVQSLAIVHAKLDADIATGSVGVGAESIRATGIQAPKKGIQVDEIVAKGVGLSALPKGGLLGWADWKANFRDAEGHIDSLEISGARSKYHGLLFEKATLTGAYAKVKARGNEVEIGLQQLTGEGLGLVPRLGLLNRRLDSLREKARVAKPEEKPALDKEIGKLATLVGELQALADRRLAAFMQLERAKTPDEIKKAKDEVAEVDGIIAYDLAQYGAAKLQLDEFGVRVSGAGDLLSDALGGGIDPLAVLERGNVTVAGAGPNDRLFKQLSLHQAQTVSHMPDKGLQADVGAFDIGETRVRIGAHKEGDSLFVDVPRFDLDSLAIDRLLLTASEGEEGFQAWSSGKSGIEHVAVRGSLRLDSRVPGSRELADYRLAQVHFDHFEIGSLYGNGLGFAMLGKKLELEIKSGSIKGIKGDGVDVAIPEDANASPVVTGRVGIDSIDKLVVGKAVVGAWAVSSGRIDAKSIGVELFEDGGIKAAVGDLDLVDFAVRGPDGWVRFSLADLGGKFGWRNGVLDVEDFHFGSLRVAAIHWKVGEKGFVEAKKPTTISDVALKGRVETKLEPAKAAPGKAVKPGETERKPSRIKIERLHIGKVESEELTYQDENNRIEIRAADPMAEKYMVGFKPLYIQNLDVWGLEWTPAGGVTSGKAKVGTYEASAHYEGLKSGLRAGIALSGKGMSAEMVGKDAFTVDVGKIEKTGGELHNAKFDTRFATGSIVGKVALGPDYIEAQNVEIAKTHFSGLRYRDLPKILTLDAVNVDRIKLGRVRQNYTISTDAATKGEKVPTMLEVRDLELFDIAASALDYKGESRGTVGEGEDKKDTVSTQHIKGRYATISHLQVSKFYHDAILDKGSFSAKIDTAAGAKPGTRPFGIQGLSAELVETVGSEKTTKSLITDVEGGPLVANDIKFATVKLGTAIGPDGKPVDVTRTSVDGTFDLTRLGFINPDLTLTDAEGKTTKIGADLFELNGIRPTLLPNGAAVVPFDSIVGRKIKVQRGSVKAEIPIAKLKDLTVGLKGLGTAKGAELLVARARTLEIAEGFTVEIEVDRSAPAAPAATTASTKPRPKLIAGDPIRNMYGKIGLEYEIPGPNAKGEISIDKGIASGGLRGFWGEILPIPEIGGLNVADFLEGAVNAPPKPPAPGGKTEPPTDLSKLRDLSVGGALKLGSGRIGLDKKVDNKLGSGDDYIELSAERFGDNVLALSGGSGGNNLRIVSPRIHATGAGFATEDGTEGSTGEIAFENLVVSISGLANLKFTISIGVTAGHIDEIRFGDVSFLDPGKLGGGDAIDRSKVQALPAPTAKDVNPGASP